MNWLWVGDLLKLTKKQKLGHEIFLQWKKIGHENFYQNLNLTEIFALKIFDVKVVQHKEHWSIDF